MPIPSLKPFLHNNLDVLFVSLNPPTYSNSNGHWFSGRQSRFYKLLYKSKLITQPVDKAKADLIIFGMNVINYRQSDYGVIDLVPGVVETASRFVRPTQTHFDNLIATIFQCKPKIVCILHSGVRDAFHKERNMKRHRISGQLQYGACGRVLSGCDTLFFLNYFPNGNNIVDTKKLKIFQEIKDLL